jgi:hypothetical protein
VNGDDDSVMGGQDEGGGMVTEPTDMPSPVDDGDGLYRKSKRRGRRTGRRTHFKRKARKARR